ncbi:mycothiol transferase [Kineococcus rubinsiae]|uniref:mycothiol transferase n=1 Tax=Kineococcus rubinsiae TaxID=2609562 RepID=UPI0014309EA4|nr:DUF664 domain-containing protein [Kineococcus rubinsiae]NIZ92818.1 DUF664 domain-containing protein [Kineococcus rubinsiae]
MTETGPDATPWEPPIAGTEAEQLLGALDRLRATFRWKADGLHADGLQARTGASALTLGGLLKHLALVEDHASTVKLTGAPLGAPWAGAEDEDEFETAAAHSPQTLYALYDGALERSRGRFAEVLRDSDLGVPVPMATPAGEHASARRLVCDLLEEYGRHTGHADLLREAVDGRVGEDPPPGWRPAAG